MHDIIALYCISRVPTYASVVPSAIYSAAATITSNNIVMQSSVILMNEAIVRDIFTPFHYMYMVFCPRQIGTGLEPETKRGGKWTDWVDENLIVYRLI